MAGSDVTLGRFDKMSVAEFLGGLLLTIRGDDKMEASVLLTKRPVALIAAMDAASSEQQRPFHLQNFHGTAWSRQQRYFPCSLAVSIPTKRLSVIIHMSRRQFRDLRRRLGALPAHAYPTD